VGIDGVDVLDPGRSEDAIFAELDVDNMSCLSVRAIGRKLSKCERRGPQDGPRWRWFEGDARFPFDGSTMRLEIQSLQAPRTLEIRSDGELLRQARIGAQSQILQIDFGDARERQIEVRSLDPCRRPVDLGINHSKRCLSFRIFGGPDLDVATLSVPVNSYFDLGRDAGEQQNLYHRPDRPQRLDKLERLLADYATSRRSIGPDGGEVELSDAEKERLRALGYLE
jgi:hypothetical protein